MPFKIKGGINAREKKDFLIIYSLKKKRKLEKKLERELNILY